MEGVSARVYNGLKGYWRRQGYRKLSVAASSSSSPCQEKQPRVEKTGQESKKKRFLRFKMKTRVKFFKTGSCKKFFVKLRDAYVNMMLGLANTRVARSGYGGGAMGQVGGVGTTRPDRNYEERMIVEIYKSIVLAQSGFIHGDNVGKLIGSDLVHQRREV